VGGYEERIGHCEVECLGGLEIDDQLEFRGLYDRQVDRLFALEKATRVKSDLSVCLYQAGSVTDEPALHYELPKPIHSRNSVMCPKFNEALHPIVKQGITTDEHRLTSCLD